MFRVCNKKMQFLDITIFGVIFAVSVQEIVSDSLFARANVTTQNLVREAGYPLEEHQVTTKDGYILTLHRIPYSTRIKNQTNGQPLPIAFMQHGALGSSSDWIIVGPPDALGYMLSDNGYDVWMGNSRGTRYSTKHIEKNPIFPPFWDFSWHEMGVYDLPAVFDYITNETGVDRLTYIGHSQGGTEFLVYCSIDHSCKERIITAHLLAPIAFVKNLRAPLAAILRQILGQSDLLEPIVGSFNIAPSTELFHLLDQIICYDYSNIQFVCSDFVYTIADPSNCLNESMIPLLVGASPAGSSLKQFVHYLQEYNSGKFRQFDNGPLLNLWTYGSLTPPDYNLGDVRVPIHLYYSENDFIATPKGIAHLTKVLPKGVVRSIYKVPPKKWNHIDFLFGMEIRKFLNDEVLKNIIESQER